MIAVLRGKIIQKSPTHTVVDVNGVGYEVLTSLQTYEVLPELQQEVLFFVQTIVREDAISLYGFASADEKKLFVLLITVSGIGPKLALTVLGGFDAAALQSAIAGRDMARLTSLPGVGKKTAERICMELADKVGALEGLAASPVGTAGVKAGVQAAPQVDAASALMNLGYTEQQVWQVLRAIEKEQDMAAGTVEDWLRQALRLLAAR